MDPTGVTLFYLAALIAWIIAAAGVGKWNVNWVAIGLALAICPSLWNAAEQAF